MSELNKYKICPSCGAHNDPRNIECDSCGSDIITVPIMTEELETFKSEINAETKPDEDKSASDFVRICDCGHENPSQARKCESCGEDISDIIPIKKKVEGQKNYIITDLEGKYSFVVPAGVIIIGREYEMRDYLKDKSYVSRLHAKLTKNSEGLFVENMNNTNYTYVNNIRIAGEKVKLSCGDLLSLGGIEKDGNRQSQAAYFIVGELE